jgi:hypothetical protein
MVQSVSETVEATRSLEKICKWPWDFPNDIGQLLMVSMKIMGLFHAFLSKNLNYFKCNYKPPVSLSLYMHAH